MENWFSKIAGSLKGILFGVVLFVVSIGLLYWNEGRVDFSNIAEKAVNINATQQNTESQNELVSVSEALKTDALLGDTYLQPANYIAISRKVEVYAWTETSETKSKKTNGENYVDAEGKNDTASEKTYIYKKEWTSNPKESSSFHFPAEHKNVPKPIENEMKHVDKAMIGIYEVDVAKANLPAFKEVTLNDANIILAKGVLTEDEEGEIAAYYADFEDIAPSLEGNYIFKGFGAIDAPEVGDVRISYLALPADQNVTVFGQLSGTKITPYIGDKNSKLYRVFDGTREESLSQMSNEHTQSTWGLRALGFILMWVSLGMLLGPLSALLDFIPLVGDLSKSVIGIATFIVAGIISTLVILISMILHNIILLIAIVIAIAGGILFFLKKKGEAKTTHPGEPTKSKQKTTK